MREEEQRTGETWKPRFFKWVANDEIASELRAKLAALTGVNLNGNVGSWVFAPDEDDRKAVEDGSLFGSA
jgi:hypothetical protein